MNHSTSSKNYREARLFFPPVKFLMSGTFSSFSTWCNDSSASVHFWQLRKNPVEAEERCPLIGRGMEIHYGNPFFVKFRSQGKTLKNDTLTAELSSTL